MCMWVGGFIVGCASAPPSSGINRSEIPAAGSPSTSDERDVLMGPPHLLSFADDDAQEDAEAQEQLSPKVLMVKKSRESLAVIQFWFNAGPLMEREGERGATSLLTPLILGDRGQRESVVSQLELRGARVRDWTTLDRYIVEVKVAPNAVPFTLEMMGKAVRKSWSQERLRDAIRLRLSRVQDDQGGGWLRQRVMLRLLSRILRGKPRAQTGGSVTSTPLTLSGDESASQIKQLTSQVVQRFYQRVTYPSENTIIIAGAISESELNRVIRDHWSISPEVQQRLDMEGVIALKRPREATQARGFVSEVSSIDELSGVDHLGDQPADEPSISVEQLNTQMALISLAFPIGKLSAEETSYLDLLSLILVGDQRGLIHRACQRAGVDLQFVGVTPVIHDERSTLIISLQVSKAQVNEAWMALLSTIGQLSRQPVSQRSLEEAKSQLERETLLVSESLSGQAQRLGFFSSRWPYRDALQRYGRAAYGVKASQLFTFTRRVFTYLGTRAIVASEPPEGLNAMIWREQLADQLRVEMSERQPKKLKGFSAYDARFSLLFAPAQSDGVTSVYVMIPLPHQKHYAKSLALGHWQAAHFSLRSPNEPQFYARFHDQMITISSTFPSSHIESAISSLIQRVRQSPLSSEFLWSSDALERSRRAALMELSLTNQRAEAKALILDRRVATAFGESPLPLISLRRRKLKDISSFELMGWFRQNIQSQPVYMVISGDVNERRLYQALSPLNQAELPPPNRALHLSPVQVTPIKLKRCRELHVSRDGGGGMINLSYRLPREIPFTQARLLESALIFSMNQKPLPRSFHLSNNRSPAIALNPTLSVQIHASNDELKQSWEALKSRIKSLKQRPLSEPQLQKLKDFTLATELGEIELSAKRAVWFASGWFMGWQSSQMKSFKDWREELDSMTAAQLQEMAQQVFQDDQRRLVVISPPRLYAELSEKCQRVSP